MKAASFFRDEIKKAFEWTAGLALTLAKGLLRIFLRLALLSAFLMMLGGGCFALRSCRAARRPPASPGELPPLQNAELWHPLAEEPPYRGKSENLENQIRASQSQVRSWDYTLRSIKRDIEYWFKKR